MLVLRLPSVIWHGGIWRCLWREALSGFLWLGGAARLAVAGAVGGCAKLLASCFWSTHASSHSSGPLTETHANAHSSEHKLHRKHTVIRIPQANVSNARCRWQWGRAIGITQPKWAADRATRTLRRRRIFCSHYQHGFGSASAKILCLVNNSICSKVDGPTQILWIVAYRKCQVHWSVTCSRQQ